MMYDVTEHAPLITLATLSLIRRFDRERGTGIIDQTSRAVEYEQNIRAKCAEAAVGIHLGEKLAQIVQEKRRGQPDFQIGPWKIDAKAVKPGASRITLNEHYRHKENPEEWIIVAVEVDLGPPSTPAEARWTCTLLGSVFVDKLSDLELQPPAQGHSLSFYSVDLDQLKPVGPKAYA